MKRIILLFIIVFLPLCLSTCKKEIEYPTSIIGKWKYFGIGHSRNNIIEVIGSQKIMEITRDSIFYLERDMNYPISKRKIKLFDYYNDYDGNNHQHVIYIEKIYILPDGSKRDLSIYYAY